jgi:hypothetical protein
VVAIALTLAACDTSTERSTSANDATIQGPSSVPSADATNGDSSCVDVDQVLSAGGSAVTQPDGTVTNVVEATSGDFTVGNFHVLEQVERSPATDFFAKLYWIPSRTEIAKTESVQITNQFLDDPKESPIVLTLGGDGTWSKTADGVYFWPSQVPFQRSGRWRLTATANGLRSGCFDVHLVG